MRPWGLRLDTSTPLKTSSPCADNNLMGRASSPHFLHPHRLQGHCLLPIGFLLIKPADRDRGEHQREIGTLNHEAPLENFILLQGALTTKAVVEKKTKKLTNSN